MAIGIIQPSVGGAVNTIYSSDDVIPDGENREVGLGVGSTLKLGGDKHFEDGRTTSFLNDTFITDPNLIVSHLTTRLLNTRVIEPRFNNAGTPKDVVYKSSLKLSTVNRTNLYTTLVAGDESLLTYDSDLNDLFLWNGTEGVSLTKNLGNSDLSLTGNRTVDLNGNDLNFLNTTNSTTASLSIVNAQGVVVNRNGGTGTFTVQNSGVNKVRLGGGADYWDSNTIYLGGLDSLTSAALRIRKSQKDLSFLKADGSIPQYIAPSTVWFFGNGFTGADRFMVGGFTQIGTEKISLQGDTLVGKAGSKVGFMGATPIVKITTAVTASTFVANTSGITDDTATFGGYTIGQMQQALVNYGLLT